MSNERQQIYFHFLLCVFVKDKLYMTFLFLNVITQNKKQKSQKNFVVFQKNNVNDYMFRSTWKIKPWGYFFCRISI